ncbi:hypothetical protein [Cellulomonas sp. URHE0023]|uniref:hypothetical protein n=1 Tax=Cellulomonas sp. URHE0023 TaxID=1380354 RepID=UPI00048A4324|nr:hypothetical protein [Cellulomonas sp. URHE0023]
MNSSQSTAPVRNTKTLGYISIGLLAVFVVLAIFRISAVSDGESHPAIEYVLVVGIIFSLIFFATLAVKFLFIGDDKD